MTAVEYSEEVKHERAPRMNINQIEAFAVVAKVKSISEAAKILHLTQPALSLQIKNLESFLGAELLKRTNKGIDITPAGEVFLEYGKAILDLYRNLRRDLENLEKGSQKQIVVGASSTIGNYALPCSIAIFRDYAPDISLILRVSNSAAVIDGILSRNFDLGFVERWVSHESLLVEKIAESDVVLIAPPDFRPVTSEEKAGNLQATITSENSFNRIGLAELQSLPLIVREVGSGTRHMLESALASLGKSLREFRIVMELNSPDAIKSAVAAGRGLAFIPYFAVRKEVYAGYVQAFKVKELDLRCPFCMIRLKDAKTSPALEKFMAFIRSTRRGFC